MKPFSFTLASALALVATGAVPASAAATPEEARRIVSVFETYVGRPANGQPSVVTVEPRGDAYRIAVDLGRLAKPLEALGVTIGPASFAGLAAPLADGTWKVTNLELPALDLSVQEQKTSVRFEGTSFEGIYDPSIFAFRTSVFKAAKTSSSSADKVSTSNRTSRNTVISSNSEKIGDGVATARVQQSEAEVQQTTSIDFGGGTPIDLKATAPTSQMDTSVERFRTRAFMNAWAFFVANPSPDLLKAKQGEMKQVLREALPLFERMGGTAKAPKLAVETPYGSGSVGPASFTVDTTGLVREGRFAFRIDYAQLALKSAWIPAWAVPLIPTDTVLDVKAEGYDAQTPAEQAIDLFDATKTPPIADAEGTRLLALLIPKGGVDVTINPTRFKAPLYEVTVDGQGFAGPLPTYKVTVKAKGLDQVIKSLQGVKGVKGTAETVVGLYAAKALSKPQGDTDVWVLEPGPNGLPLVNGKPIGG